MTKLEGGSMHEHGTWRSDNRVVEGRLIMYE